MQHHSDLIQHRHSLKHRPQLNKSLLKFILLISIFAIATPVLADYIGPRDRTVTETNSTCKVVLNRCQYVPAKDDYRYHNVGDWSCSNESKPWLAYPDQPPRDCLSTTVGDRYWEREETIQEVTITYPPATVSSLLQNCTMNNGWCATSPQLSLNGSEPISGQSILAIEGTLNGQIFACSGANCSVPLNEGNNSLAYWALSSWGDSSTMGTLTAKVDTQLPNITGAFTGALGSNGWYLTPVSFTGNASDATSGLASFTCTLDGVALGSCNSINVNNEGLHTIVLTARDNAGRTNTLSQNVSLDTQNPILNAALSGTQSSNNWYTAALINASASDPAPGSGLAAFEYNLDSSSWTTFPTSGVLTPLDGKHSVDIHAMDTAGRTVSSSKSFWLDTLAPNVTVDNTGTFGTNNWYTTDVNLTASASDATSGMDVFEYSMDDSAWTTYSSPLNLTDGMHSLSFWAQDFAGLVTQVDRSYKVDTRAPQIGGSLSGVPGTNGWYISDVRLSASAIDPTPGSGIDTFTYILNDNAETPYSDALTVSDGQHTVQLNAQDQAGWIYSTRQVLNVDTVYPFLNVQTTLPNWIRDNVALNGAAGDSGSGLSKVEISTDGGQTWQAVIGTTSWSYVWSTQNGANGIHNVHVRATDNAGQTTKRNFSVGVDNRSPKISVPDSWYQWDTVTLDIWDDDSGLSEARLEISDPQGRWPTRIIRLNPGLFPLDFKWDRRFGDDTVAPLGTYNVKVVAFDKLGNLTRTSASINILLGVLPAGPTATPQPSSRPTDTSTPTPIQTITPSVNPISSPMLTETAVVSIFGATFEPTSQATPRPTTSPISRATPTQSSVLDWLQSVFEPSSNTAESVTEVVSSVSLSVSQSSDSRAANSPSSPLWGAAAAAMIGTATAYALEEKRKRQEEEARQAAQVRAEVNAKNDAIQASQEAKHEALKVQNWLQGQAILSAQIEEAKKQGATSGQISALKQLGATQGLGAAIDRAASLTKSLYTATLNTLAHANIRTARKEALVEEELRALSAKPQEWEDGYNAYMAQKATLDWRAGEKEIYVVKPKEKSWWEKSIDWIDEHQAEIALGIGVVVGVGAILLSGGVAAPLVAVTWMAGAAVAAGGTVALGTMGLNAYYGRPWNENLARNIAIAEITAAVITGGWFLFQTGTIVATSYCARNTTACARVEPLLNAIDTAEEIWLSTKLGFQTWIGDDIGAVETAFELHSEHVDGGMPGNSIAKELGGETLEKVARYGDEALDLIKLYGDDAAQIIFTYGDEGIAILQKYGDDSIDLFQHYGDDAIELIALYEDESIGFIKLAENLDVDPTEILDDPPLPGQTPEGWLLKISNLNSPVNKQRNLKLSDSQIDYLLDESLQNPESNEFVLGFFDPNKLDGYIEVGEGRKATHLSMPKPLYNQVGFGNDTGDFWPLNRAAIQKGIDKRKTFVLSTDLQTILSNPGKYTYAEIKMILHPGNNYIHVYKDGYDMLIPAETLIP